MTTLVWLAASSLVWGAVLWSAAIALQSGNDLSGRARQWIWRGTAALLIMPWLAVPVVGVLAPDLSGSVAPRVVVSEEPASFGESAFFDEPVTAAAVDAPSIQPAVVVEQGIPIPWIEVIVAVVTGGWLLRGIVAGRAARHLRGIISESRAGDGASLATLARWSRALGLRRMPELRVVSANTSPFSTGVMKPLVCLPEGIEQNIHAQTLDLVVGHECIHVARGDGWRRPLERSIADIMWFNPFAWAIRRELDLARELACDEAVVAASSQRKAYARTLRVVAGMAAALPASAPAASMSLSGGGRLLAMRMKRTLDAAARRPARAAIAGAVMLAFAATPMAIAQAILIEAVQPPDAPAPPAPPSASALATAPQAPIAPTPPIPPKAPEQVKISPDGTVRIDFPARVMETGGSADKGYRVTVLQTSKNSEGEICSAKVDGLSSLSVSKDQTLAKGAVIGERGKSGALSVAVKCSDETDGDGWPKGSEATPVPPVPPTPPAPVDAVAPVAPVGPVSAPSGVSRPALVVPPAPPAPVAAPSAIAPPVPVVPAVPSAPASPYQEIQNSPVSGFEALYETENLITLRGKIVRVEWSAPRSRMHLQEEGTERRWIVVGGSPYDLTSEQRASVQVGTDVVVHAYQTRDKRCDPACAAFGRDFDRADGTPLVRPPVRAVAPSLEIAPTLPVARTPTPIQFTPGNSESVLEGAARRTSAFGYRTDPFSNTTVFHTGIDLAQKPDSPVRAPGDAVVTFAGTKEGYGRMVELAVTDNVRLRLGHLNRIEVELGEQVEPGQVIGTVGNSGPGTGPHVHLEVLRDGIHVDPESVEGLVLFGG